MYRGVIYDFIWFGDGREGFEVFGDILVLSVKEQIQIGFCYPEENSHGRRNSNQETTDGLCFCIKAKKQIL